MTGHGLRKKRAISASKVLRESSTSTAASSTPTQSKLKVQLTYYDQNPEKNPDEKPMYTREIEVSTKEGVKFSTF